MPAVISCECSEMNPLLVLKSNIFVNNTYFSLVYVYIYTYMYHEVSQRI